MTTLLPNLRINSERILAAFNELAHSPTLGATGDGGVNRHTFSEAHLATRAWFREQIEKSGLEFRTDGAGRDQNPSLCASHLGFCKCRFGEQSQSHQIK